ncbi:MAG: mercury(II) reductase [Bacteroidetes bacterium]|nr:mercury(II) reductase [Bacteroidota bacterium]
MFNKLFGNKKKSKTQQGQIETITLNIKGMTCDHCATSIEKKVSTLDGIIEEKVSYPEESGGFRFDASKTSRDAIINTINALGSYQVLGETGANGHLEEKRSPVSSKNKESGQFFDLIIIGGGSAAFAAAIQAEELGLSTLMVNAGLPIGGTCVNVGCVPSKYLIRAAESIRRASFSPFDGITTKKPDWDYKKIIQQKKALVGELQKKKYLDIVGDLSNVKVVVGWAKFTSEKTIIVGDETYTGLKFILATGATTYIPDYEGLKEVDYLTNVSLFDLEEQPESLIILGAGYIALEIAQAYNRFGTNVQIVHRSERILRSQMPDITDELHKHLTNDGIDIQLNNTIQKVSKSGNKVNVEAIQNGQPKSYEATHILVATGTQPNSRGIGLEEIGVELGPKGHIKVNSKQETSLPHIYAVGDCTNTPAFVYTAAYEGKIAVQNAFSGKMIDADYTGLPWVIFTDPQVAGAGMDEKAAEEAGIPYETSVVPLTEVPRSQAALDTRGFIKLIRNPETDKLIGARIVAPEGGELAMQASLAIKYSIPVEDLANSFHPYLTLSEGIKLAAITFHKDVAELSCCAS